MTGCSLTEVDAPREQAGPGSAGRFTEHPLPSMAT